MLLNLCLQRLRLLRQLLQLGLVLHELTLFLFSSVGGCVNKIVLNDVLELDALSEVSPALLDPII